MASKMGRRGGVPFRFTTANSEYQVDGAKVRRLRGVNRPTPRQGHDGRWMPVVSIGPVLLGHGVVIVWRVDRGDGVTVLRTTVTSPVVSIERGADA